MKDENYINIQGWMITKLKLTGNELVLYAIIYGFSQDGETKYRGSLSYMQKATNLSKRTIVNLIDRLVKAKLIKKEFNQTGNLYSAEIAPVPEQVVQKVHRGSAKNAPLTSAKNAHNNNKYNNKDNNTSSNEVANMIKLFEKLDIKNKTYYSNKTQRAKAKFLIEHHGVEKISNIIDVILKVKGDRFLPSISSPYDLVEKWSKLEDYFRRKKTDSDELANKVIF